MASMNRLTMVRQVNVLQIVSYSVQHYTIMVEIS